MVTFFPTEHGGRQGYVLSGYRGQGMVGYGAENSTQREGALILFSQWQIVVGALFGGMPLGCAFVALNYHSIRSVKNARIFWLLAGIGLVVGLFLPVWLPLALLSAIALGFFLARCSRVSSDLSTLTRGLCRGG